MLVRLPTFLAAIVLAGLVCASAASAYRAPTEQELAEITAATNRSPEINHEYTPVLSDVRVSSEGEWATATISGSVGPGVEQDAIGIYRAGPTPQWTLEKVGNEFCVGPVLSKLGMPRAVGLELGFKLCPRPRPEKVFVIRSVVTDRLVYRPHSIGLSGDGTFSLYRIRWHSYEGPIARATAIAYVKGCTPSCANGHVDRPRAKLRFTTRVECAGREIYARMHFTLRGDIPSGYRRQGWISMRPTNEYEGSTC